jgi:hypothetical protein
MPRLPALLDSLLEVLLDNLSRDSAFWSHIGVMIGYLYSYHSIVKSIDFTKQLKYDHRQYHIDALSGMMETGTLLWYQHQIFLFGMLSGMGPGSFPSTPQQMQILIT